ncbi:MAG: DUF167 domain-containing protein [Pyrinomonadaceae bacterium]|nr:DUF167 domain-containing protein [Pyrinomonadaceae bacterium]
MKFVEKDGAVTFDVRVVPRASRSEVIGEHDGALKVRIASPPVDGAANAELIRMLAKAFGTAKSDIDIISGSTSKTKRVSIRGRSPAAVEAVLKGKT